MPLRFQMIQLILIECKRINVLLLLTDFLFFKFFLFLVTLGQQLLRVDIFVNVSDRSPTIWLILGLILTGLLIEVLGELLLLCDGHYDGVA